MCDSSTKAILTVGMWKSLSWIADTLFDGCYLHFLLHISTHDRNCSRISSSLLPVLVYFLRILCGDYVLRYIIGNYRSGASGDEM